MLRKIPSWTQSRPLLLIIRSHYVMPLARLLLGCSSVATERECVASSRWSSKMRRQQQQMHNRMPKPLLLRQSVQILASCGKKRGLLSLPWLNSRVKLLRMLLSSMVPFLMTMTACQRGTVPQRSSALRQKRQQRGQHLIIVPLSSVVCPLRLHRSYPLGPQFPGGGELFALFTHLWGSQDTAAPLKWSGWQLPSTLTRSERWMRTETFPSILLQLPLLLLAQT
mmetsp:Transcript_1176/g.2514  ORF Transcript_1176/g.2514 Transcript_1176/m.2514 type:complete len:224 (-) Transcript_1176:1716-2387(-)